MMSSSPVALEDIAKSLGIAVSTVSRALRELPGIHPTTRERILRQAETMGYVAPRKRKEEVPQPRNILVLTSGAAAVPSGYMAGMSRLAPAFNISLQSHVVSNENTRGILDPKHQPPALRMGLVSGVILIYSWPDEVVEALAQKGPVVSIVNQYPELPVDMVGIDHLSGMVPLVRRLRERGNERIGFFGLRPDIGWTRSRFAAYAEAMTAFGLPLRFEDVVEVPDAQSVIRVPQLDPHAFERVFKKIGEGVRAWVCANDIVASALCAGLLQRGVRIPEDVAVTGFHRREDPWAHLPQLTTTEVRDDVLGEAAVRRMVHRLDHPAEQSHLILVPCKYFQGETA